jgi:hypothetical protein
MPNISKKVIAEQIKYRIAAGYPDYSDAVLEDDIYVAIGQKLNAKFKLEYFDTTLPSGETIPNGASLATYESIPVVSLSNSRSKAVLPVTPISLPRNMGVFSIEDPNGEVSFIPLLPTQRILLKQQPLINDLLGQVGYEVKGKVLEFTKDLSLFGINAVTMQLAVMDINLYSETDVLPIPADREEEIVNELYEQFAPIEARAEAKAKA